MFFGLLLWIACFIHWSASRATARLSWSIQPYQRTTWALALTGFAQITKTSFRLLACLPDLDVVATAPAVRCTSSSYRLLLVLAIPCIVIVSIGLPLSIAVILYRN